ncbi:hypothetical protein [Elstera sp.]|uniref:hypothetical protein n=1 Tax=Elstera sp. TaxID=1916664 RepID=UPI0037C0FE19
MLERQGVAALLAHTELCVAVAESLMEAAEQAALLRIQQRDETVEAGLQTCLSRFRRMMTDNRLKSRLETDCAFAYQTATGIAPTPRALAANVEAFEAFAALNDARLRRVPLPGGVAAAVALGLVLVAVAVGAQLVGNAESGITRQGRWQFARSVFGQLSDPGGRADLRRSRVCTGA